MQEIMFQLEDDDKKVQYYCIIEYNRLYVLPSKALEKRVFWEEFKDYELKHGKILRYNNYKDNILSRLLGRTKKNQKTFDTDTDIGIMNFDYFSTGSICLSIQKIYQDGMQYLCDFVVCCTDTVNLFNFYNTIKDKALIWGTSPFHLRGRCNVQDITKYLSYDYFCSVDYILRVSDYTYIEDKEVFDIYLERLSTWCSIHNEELFIRLDKY